MCLVDVFLVPLQVYLKLQIVETKHCQSLTVEIPESTASLSNGPILDLSVTKHIRHEAEAPYRFGRSGVTAPCDGPHQSAAARRTDSQRG